MLFSFASTTVTSNATVSPDIIAPGGFVEPAKNTTHLKKLIELSIKNPKHKIWKNQRKNFNIQFPFINKYTKSLKNKILRMYE